MFPSKCYYSCGKLTFDQMSQIQDLSRTTDSNSQAGIEVVPDTGPEIAPQPDANRYYTGSEASHGLADTPDPPLHPSIGTRGPQRALWALAVITVLCVAVALGAGLGAGLAIHYKSHEST